MIQHSELLTIYRRTLLGEDFWHFRHGRSGLASLIVIHDITKQVGYVYYFGARLCS
jgi:hypothetical protein